MKLSTAQLQAGYLKVIAMMAALLLAVYPSTMFAFRGGVNGAFIGLLFIVLCTVVVRPIGLPKLRWRQEFTAYVFAMLLLACALLISEYVNNNLDGYSHDAPARYWLAIPIFLLLVRLPLSTFRLMEIGFPVSALIGIMKLDIAEFRSGIDTLDLIHFGDGMLILGALSLFSLNWQGKDGRLLVFLKIVGFMAGVAGSFLSGSRGGWLAIPVLIFLYLYYKGGKVSLRLLAGGVALVSGLFLLTYLTTSTFQQRVEQLYQDVVEYESGNKNTSIGIRWQIYQAGAEIFIQHPFVGVGRIGFEERLTEMAQMGRITPEAAELGRAEAHSDILAKTVSAGILGLIAILALYLVPLNLFWKAARSQNAQVRQVALMGVAFVSSIMIFGLTVEFLRLTMAAAFYGLTVASLLAFCYNMNHQPLP